MSDLPSDRELLEWTWRTYDEQFAEHVGDVQRSDGFAVTSARIREDTLD